MFEELPGAGIFGDFWGKTGDIQTKTDESSKVT
jgi:hypothetical protein